MRFLFILLFLVSCGPAEDFEILLGGPHKKKVIVQVEELRPYLDMFEKHSAQYGDGVIIDDLIIGFGEVDIEGDNDFTLGVCYRWPNRTPEVVLDIGHWQRMDATRRILLVYHELGHCILNRGHVEEGLYDSIMNPYLVLAKTFNSDPIYFLEELFDPGRSNDWLLLHDKEKYKCNH